MTTDAEVAPPLVSDLVLSVLDASCGSISAHFARIFERSGANEDYNAEYWLTKTLQQGDTFDLEEDLPDLTTMRFSHSHVSELFFDRLAPVLKNLRSDGRIVRGIDKHLWAQDYERKLRSLFPRGFGGSFEGDAGRTRMSSLVQQALLTARRSFQAEKASTAFRGPEKDRPGVLIPSPFYIAAQALSDPESPASEAYAMAALRVDLVQRTEALFGRRLELTYDNITRSLETIRNRGSTSKAMRGAGRAETAFLCHYLACRGLMLIYSEWDREHPQRRVDRLCSSLETFFRESRDTIQFRVHSDYEELPSASELMNELQGLPVPLEGGPVVFNGGIRFGTGGDIVAAVSGPFGAGKTTTCLSFAAALAPLGCRTLFFSCEESQEDIERRLAEAAPEQPFRSTPLLRCLTLNEFRDATERAAWFQAHKLRVKQTAQESAQSNTYEELIALFKAAIATAPIFAPFKDRAAALLPPFAYPIIIIDGFHQLARECGLTSQASQVALRELIDACRELDAIFIFTIAQDEPEMRRLDYLCDVVIELDRTGFGMPEEQITRLFRLLKARRQPCRAGTHVFHLAGPKSFRIKPSVSARGEIAKSRKWTLPNRSKRILLTDQDEDLEVDQNSQILVYGSGSTGKAGLGLYLLNRRPTESRRAPDSLDPPLFEDLTDDDAQDVEKSIREGYDPRPIDRARLRIPTNLPFYESRTLVLSFLYPPQYFRTLGRHLKRAPRKVPSARRELHRQLPDRTIIDTIALYPGALRPEDLLAKIENRLSAAELRGIPYTGVLVDGIHNVFVQFPRLEADRSFWPQLYAMLRTRSVTVVTTHTQFELRHSQPTASFAAEFDDAQRRAGPLLSVLVSASDYTFELSSKDVERGTQYRLYARSGWGEDPPPGFLDWDRQNLKFRGRYAK